MTENLKDMPITMQVAQEVFRAITLSLALEQKADMARLSAVLQTFSTNPEISPAAHLMLLDLAGNIGALGAVAATKN